ncbi:hypothetical protein EV401DRAFT_2069205 [Pisolithus croceorrhizus]|nr:hypothetical protein EV401DRAFT_2069205 [Pisolithus croceorrhizus]
MPAFFGALWCKLLDKAKGRMWLYVAIDGAYMEILVEMVIKYKDDGLELEAGNFFNTYYVLSVSLLACFYPKHQRSMAMILFNDMQTFCSEVKKVTTHIVIFIKKAAQLLKVLSIFGDTRLIGRTSNFAHSALKKTCLLYCTSSKSLCQFAKFQEPAPFKAFTLVLAIIWSILMIFKKHG